MPLLSYPMTNSTNPPCGTCPCGSPSVEPSCFCLSCSRRCCSTCGAENTVTLLTGFDSGGGEWRECPRCVRRGLLFTTGRSSLYAPVAMKEVA